jgi:hypothetical protein
MDHPTCPHCGQPLDIVIENEVARPNDCTNPDCPGNQQQPPESPNRSNSYT